ncbi:copper transporter 6-like [Chenopodium quinoa]|uniref:Copper transport protein n=1 Tax=Chenopodium quinoa TaxID=63459 RepID=A0A803KRR3_CHEQI|nr:copper transporter 6-like [Chenopodium quinoa]
MDHGSMNGMNMAPSSNSTSTMGAMGHKKKMMMHMSFYWGKNAEILFNGWPGTHTGMYVLSLIFVFLLAFFVEGFSRSRFVKDNGRNAVVSGVVLTLLHTLRMGLAYLVMLAVMSFNAGVFIAAIAGHAIGFLVFGTRVFIKGSQDPGKSSDLHPISC